MCVALNFNVMPLAYAVLVWIYLYIFYGWSWSGGVLHDSHRFDLSGCCLKLIIYFDFYGLQ